MIFLCSNGREKKIKNVSKYLIDWDSDCKSGIQKEAYVYDDSERDLIMERMQKDNKNTKVSIQRYKGLGEMNSDQLWDTTMDPDRRTLLKVTVESAEEAVKTFQNLMGSDVEARRSFIEKRAKEVVNLDV